MNTHSTSQTTSRKLKLTMLLLMPLTLGFMLMACTMAFTPITAMSQNSTVDAATSQNAVENAAWGNNVDINVNSSNVTISSNGLPSHERLDFYLFGGRPTADPTNAVNVSFTLPLQPEYTGTATNTSPGAIGIVVSGAVFFNPYEGDQVSYAIENIAVQNGVPFIDACNGHPLPQNGQYHYHGIPYCITDVIDTAGEHSVILGYLVDGFSIYGPQDTDGNSPTNLDECNGHFGATPEFPNGSYHYHTTDVRPYIPDCYMGTPTINGPGGGQGSGPPGGGPPGGGPPGN